MGKNRNDESKKVFEWKCLGRIEHRSENGKWTNEVESAIKNLSREEEKIHQG